MTGSFLGKFITNSEIIGLWSTPDGRLNSPFYLIKETTFNKIKKLPIKKTRNNNEVEKIK